MDEKSLPTFLPMIKDDEEKFQHLKDNIGYFADNVDVFITIKWLIDYVEQQKKY